MMRWTMSPTRSIQYFLIREGFQKTVFFRTFFLRFRNFRKIDRFWKISLKNNMPEWLAQVEGSWEAASEKMAIEWENWEEMKSKQERERMRKWRERGRNADLLPLHVFSFLPLNLHVLSQKRCFLVCCYLLARLNLRHLSRATSVEKILIKTASERAPQLVPTKPEKNVCRLP